MQSRGYDKQQALEALRSWDGYEKMIRPRVLSSDLIGKDGTSVHLPFQRESQ
jgi:hypothetical protein